MTINENGRRKRISKHEVVIKQLAKQAMTGNIPAFEYILAFINNHSRGRSWNGELMMNSGHCTADDVVPHRI